MWPIRDSPSTSYIYVYHLLPHIHKFGISSLIVFVDGMRSPKFGERLEKQKSSL